METSIALLLICVSCLGSSLLTWFLLDRRHLKTLDLYSRLLSQQSQQHLSVTQEQTKVQLSLVQLNQKSQALVAASDPIAYQQIQVMGPTSGYSDYDPSDNGESKRIAERDGQPEEDELSGFEQDILNGIFRTDPSV